MNRAKKFLSLALLAFLSAVACQKPDQPQPDPTPAITIPTQSQAFFDSGISFPTPSSGQTQPQTQTVTFTTTESWTSTVVDTKSSTWLTVEPSSGSAGTVNMKVTAQPNDTDKSRSATVTIKSGSMSKSFSVTQEAKPAPVAVTEVTLDKTELSLKEGESETLTATVKPDNADDKTVTWSSSDEAVATVENGKVTAIKEGTATITAKAGEKSATCKVTVSKNVVAVTSITLNKTALSLTEGESETLTATVKPDDATDKTVTWSTSDTAIATVDQNGKVTAVKEGTATITAKAGEKTATCKVTVNGIPVASITLNKTKVTLHPGETDTLVATVSPDNASDQTITWTSSYPAAVTVDDNGKITAVAVGASTIHASCGGKSASCEVTVDPIPVESITLNKTEMSLKEGESETLTATVKPDDATDKTVTWSTSDTDTAIATVDQNGKVTAVKEGTATITAKAGDKTATCSVTVTGSRISVSPSSLSFLASGGTKQIQVTCNGDWSVSGQPDWCRLSMTSGSGNATIQLTAAQNSGAQRTAQLTLSCAGKTAIVKITQTGGGWQNMSFVHKSLYMMFSSVYCPHSETMDQKIHETDGSVGNKYNRVDVYESSLGEAAINFPEAERLKSLYYSGTPSGVLDYRIQINNSTAYSTATQDKFISAIHQQEELYPAVTGISFSSSFSGTSLSVKGKVYSHEAETFLLSVFLLEDKVVQGTKRHDNVLRMSLSDVLGDMFTINTRNTIFDFQYNVTIPEEYNTSNLSILVIVQRYYGNQPIVRDLYVNDYYVDNCRKAPLGVAAELEINDNASGDGNEGIGIGDEITF